MTGSKHTEAARDVLARCEYLLDELKAKPIGIAWQAKLSGTIALLRSVGHVLNKVDAAASPAARAEVDRWWAAIKSTKSTPDIFWDFIEVERNLILKEGQLRAGQSATVQLVGVQAAAIAAGQTPPPESPKQSPKASYSYHMNDGPFTGHHPHDLVAKALQWWRDQLDLIDSKIS